MKIIKSSKIVVYVFILTRRCGCTIAVSIMSNVVAAMEVCCCVVAPPFYFFVKILKKVTNTSASLPTLVSLPTWFWGAKTLPTLAYMCN
jgi:hypothetical protein